jgi:hypothetical protein
MSKADQVPKERENLVMGVMRERRVLSIKQNLGDIWEGSEGLQAESSMLFDTKGSYTILLCGRIPISFPC